MASKDNDKTLESRPTSSVTIDEKSLGAGSQYHYAHKPSLLAQGLGSLLPEPRRGSYVAVEPASPTFQPQLVQYARGRRTLIVGFLRRAIMVGPVLILMVL